MKQYGVLGVFVAILIGLANPAMAAPLTLADLDADTDGVVQLEDVGSGVWEISFIANTELFAVTVGIADKANVSNVNFLGQSNNLLSFTNVTTLASFVISATVSTQFAANTAETIANFQYSNGWPRFDNTGVEVAFGPLLLKPAPPFAVGIDLARVEFRVVPEPSTWLLLSLGIAGMVMIRRKLASRA